MIKSKTYIKKIDKTTYLGTTLKEESYEKKHICARYKCFPHQRQFRLFLRNERYRRSHEGFGRNR